MKKKLCRRRVLRRRPPISKSNVEYCDLMKWLIRVSKKLLVVISNWKRKQKNEGIWLGDLHQCPALSSICVPILNIYLSKIIFLLLGMGSLFWIVVAELFEGPVRPYGISCGILVAGISAFGLTFSFPVLVNSIGPAILYYFFAGCNVVVCLVIYFIVPETKGRTFAEIQTALGRKNVEKVDMVISHKWIILTNVKWQSLKVCLFLVISWLNGRIDTHKNWQESSALSGQKEDFFFSVNHGKLKNRVNKY